MIDPLTRAKNELIPIIMYKIFQYSDNIRTKLKPKMVNVCIAILCLIYVVNHYSRAKRALKILLLCDKWYKTYIKFSVLKLQLLSSMHDAGVLALIQHYNLNWIIHS